MIFQIIVSYSPYTKKDQSLFDHIKQCVTYDADTDEEINKESDNRHEDNRPQLVVENHTLEKPPIKNENNQPKRPKQTNITQFFKESPK